SAHHPTSLSVPTRRSSDLVVIYEIPSTPLVRALGTLTGSQGSQTLCAQQLNAHVRQVNTPPPMRTDLSRPGHTWPRPDAAALLRSEEHTSELQSRFELVCR